MRGQPPNSPSPLRGGQAELGALAPSGARVGDESPDIPANPPAPLIPPHKGEGDDCSSAGTISPSHRPGFPPPCGEGLRVGVGRVHNLSLLSPPTKSRARLPITPHGGLQANSGGVGRVGDASSTGSSPDGSVCATGPGCSKNRRSEAAVVSFLLTQGRKPSRGPPNSVTTAIQAALARGRISTCTIPRKSPRHLRFLAL
jgi:hypothetical protein